MTTADSDSIPNATKRHLLGLTLEEMEAIVAELGEPEYRARQIHSWIYARRSSSFDEMTSLSRALRANLEERTSLRSLSLLDTQTSDDGTVKYLFRTLDGYNIEAVLIPSEARDDQEEPKRQTLCLSTQIGCPLDCQFCATASMKLKRNLTAGEIVEQFLQVAALSGREITNVVYMGMGEPMLNFDNVFRSVEVLSAPENEFVSARRITVSTSGLPDAIRRMADEGRRAKLAISLHALTNKLRSELMPINRRFDLKQVLDAVEYYYRKSRWPVTYEYILFAGLNDTDDDVKRLARIARRVPSKVNVIPFHAIDFTSPEGIAATLHATAPDRFDAFVAALRTAGVQVMVRSSSGVDIDAACGQLAIKHTAAGLSAQR